ncbi:MAG: hypothetical protein HGA23_01085 [Bacteroidales bacterium]|nr:hypothetical protein [Bacteroidales bacterium]
MKKKEVPQDEGLNEGRFEDVCYALDENGNYVAVLSKGWQPKTDALLQAWEVIDEEVELTRQRVLSGEVSPIAFYMEKNLMDLKLLSDYVGLPKRKIRKHLKPDRFKKLDEETLLKYAETFGISVEMLRDFRETLKDK